MGERKMRGKRGENKRRREERNEERREEKKVKNLEKSEEKKKAKTEETMSKNLTKTKKEKKKKSAALHHFSFSQSAYLPSPNWNKIGTFVPSSPSVSSPIDPNTSYTAWKEAPHSS